MTRSRRASVLAQAFAQAQHYQESRTRAAPRPEVSTDALRASFAVGLPDVGRAPTDVIDLLSAAAAPGLVGNTGANFFGWVMGASSQVGIAADMLTSAWGQNAAIYQTAPSAAVAEEVAAEWLLELLDLPRQSSVGFTTGATMASFIALAAARDEVLRRRGWDLEADGLVGAPAVRVVVSAEAHASVLAVLKYLGFGSRTLTRIPTDGQGRMRVEELRSAVDATEDACIVIAQAGHINSGAFDRLDRIADVTERRNAWLHVDGAFGLWARCSPGHASLAAGAERADSWAVDGHKWLQVPYDSGYAIVRDARAHRRAMSMSASYLSRDEHDGRNPSEYGPELSRRARGFTTWAVLQALGRRGLREMVERHCACAARLARRLVDEPGIEVLNDVVLNQVAVTFDESMLRTGVPGISDHAAVDLPSRNARSTDAVIVELQRENTSFASGADWRGHRILRVSVIAEQTRAADIDRLAASIVRAWRRVRIEACATVAVDASRERVPEPVAATPDLSAWPAATRAPGSVPRAI